MLIMIKRNGVSCFGLGCLKLPLSDNAIHTVKLKNPLNLPVIQSFSRAEQRVHADTMDSLGWADISTFSFLKKGVNDGFSLGRV